MKTNSTLLQAIIFALLFTLPVKSQLNGVKTIGGTNPDYESIGEAVDSLTSQGIDGDVVFNIRDGVYYDHIELSSFPGTENYSVIFQSESLDTSAVYIYDTLKGNWADPKQAVLIESVNNLTIRYLTIIKKDGGSQDDIIEATACRNLSILNNRLKVETGDWVFSDGINVSAQFDTISQINIHHNYIDACEAAIRVSGNSSKTSNKVYISNNEINNARESGIFIVYIDSSNIYKNLVKFDPDFASGSSSGIHIWAADSFSVHHNDIRARGRGGLVIDDCKNANPEINVVYNNFISNEVTELLGQGMLISNSSNVTIVYNSINASFYDGAVAPMEGVKISESGNVKFINNSIAVDNYFALTLDSKDSTGLDLDYNNYFSEDSDLFNLNYNYITTLSDWQDSTDLDIHSISADPVYNSFTDLHVSTATLDKKGTPLGGFYTDIDGDTRDTESPDIGADEYEVPNSKPVINDQVFTVNENSADGTVIGTIVATDADIDQSLTFYIIDGNTNSTFAIDSLNGELTINDSTLLDYETNPSFILEVRVKDSGLNPESDTADITINLIDIDESDIDNLESVSDKNMILYPNPSADGIFNISLPESTADIEVINLEGRRVLQFTTSSTQLDLSSLSKGVYILKIKTTDGLIRKKIEITR